MNERPFHTRLYTRKGTLLLQTMRAAFLEHWPTGQMRNAVHRMRNLEVAPDGEVIINPEVHQKVALWKKSDEDIFRWLAIHLKLVVKNFSGCDWSRTNDTVVSTLSSNDIKVTVSDAYMVYDHWLNRKKFDTHFSKEHVNSIIGFAKDPVSTEMEVARREEVKRLHRECTDTLLAAEHEMFVKIREFEKKVQSEFNELRSKLTQERDAKIAELDKMVSQQP